MPKKILKKENELMTSTTRVERVDPREGGEEEESGTTLMQAQLSSSSSGSGSGSGSGSSASSTIVSVWVRWFNDLTIDPRSPFAMWARVFVFAGVLYSSIFVPVRVCFSA